MTGTFVGIFDASLQWMLLESSAGSARMLRIFGLVLLGASLYMPKRLRAALGLFGVASAIGSFGLMGHTSVHELRWILAPLLFIHLSVVAFWFGSLLPLGVVTGFENASDRNQILATFSNIALWTVPAIAVAGVSILYLLLPNLAALQTPYGISAIAKSSGFVVLMVLAGLNKMRYLPGIQAGDAMSLRGIRRSMAMEWVVICLVFTFTAVMTALFSPGH
jgi:copper resistance protein D